MTSKSNNSGSWLRGKGEMVDLVRTHDWARTPLGPLERWPQRLRNLVSMTLASRAQIVIFWGADFTIVYNDAYRPVFGGKHPSALGMSGREAWSEIWHHQLGPLLQGVVDSGEAFHASDLLFCLERHGYLEETYFDVSYDPVRDDDGVVAGVRCIVSETTGRVVGERRLRTLGSLGRIGAQAQSTSSIMDRAADVLSKDPEDLAFALLYEWDARHERARLCASTPDAAALASHDWGLVPAIPREGTVVDLPARADAPWPGGCWPEPCRHALVIPIMVPSQGPAGFLVAGISPRRAFDAAYRDFLGLAAAGLGSALSNAKALEAERNRAQALADLDHAKTTFFGNVSHEFRTPLTLMLGPLRDELADARLPQHTRESLELAYRNGLRMLKLVNALLDFSRIEAGRMTARFERTDLAGLTADLAGAFRSACESAGLRLHVSCEPAAHETYVDREMWEKIVLNLLSNAFKFTFDGGIEVRLADDGDRAVLTVRDSGVGIPPGEMPRLFERFHRVEGTRARTHEGSGIGLAMVSELVRIHGGEIRAQSEPGKGSVFTVSVPHGHKHLPADQVAEGRARAEGEATPHAAVHMQEVLGWLRSATPDGLPMVTPSEAGRARILVADDNADMREYIRRLLNESWDVVCVADGVAAMQALLTARFDLVICDVMMPRMGGFELLAAIRADPSMRDMPVLMLSARAGEEARVVGRDAGADDYLVKPFTARELVGQVRAHLAMSRARRGVARERELLLASERSARMDAQRQWEDLMRLFEQAPNPMVILRGASHVIELANPAACAVWGRTQQQVAHKPLFEALPEIRGQGLEAMLETVIATGVPYHGRHTPVRLDRGSGMETVYFDFVYSPLRAASGRVEGVAVTAFDVTQDVVERKALEAAR